jgi:hypothetical protein
VEGVKHAGTEEEECENGKREVVPLGSQSDGGISNREGGAVANGLDSLRRRVLLLYSGSSRSGGRGGLVAINFGVDAHAAMCDMNLRCTAWGKDMTHWESYAAITPLD